MEEMAEHMLRVEKGWLLSQIGLIPDCDDDVMDEVGGVCVETCASFADGLCLTVCCVNSKNGVRARGCSCVSL